MRRLRVAPRDGEPQAAKLAGGHRIRVTPVPIPNTEVKPDTADGTVWETVWESRSLPALFLEARSLKNDRAFSFVSRNGVRDMLRFRSPARRGRCERRSSRLEIVPRPRARA